MSNDDIIRTVNSKFKENKVRRLTILVFKTHNEATGAHIVCYWQNNKQTGKWGKKIENPEIYTHNIFKDLSQRNKGNAMEQNVSSRNDAGISGIYMPNKCI